MCEQGCDVEARHVEYLIKPIKRTDLEERRWIDLHRTQDEVVQGTRGWMEDDSKTTFGCECIPRLQVFKFRIQCTGRRLQRSIRIYIPNRRVNSPWFPVRPDLWQSRIGKVLIIRRQMYIRVVRVHLTSSSILEGVSQLNMVQHEPLPTLRFAAPRLVNIDVSTAYVGYIDGQLA